MPLTPEERIEQLQKTIDEMKQGWDGHGARLKKLEDELEAAKAAKAAAEAEAAAKAPKAGTSSEAAKRWPW